MKNDVTEFQTIIHHTAYITLTVSRSLCRWIHDIVKR